uniref:MARVEL domain-containing protein n=1 Tax=Geospiza parvula TaxID=87175 RepID=A0A8U8BLB9_GEOPR
QCLPFAPQLFSIFAFATCGGFSGSLRLSIECAPPNRSAPITVAFGYPFRWALGRFWGSGGGFGGRWGRVFLVGDHSSAAQFFVTVGVGSFLYAPAALGGYLFAPQAYRAGGGAGPDLGVTAALAFLWLVSSCAWGAALAEVQGGHVALGGAGPGRGVPAPGGAVFGFLNLVLWTGNLWFVFKETGWGGLGARAPPPGSPKAPAPEGGTAPRGGVRAAGGYGQPGGLPARLRPGGTGGPLGGGYGQGAPNLANQM